MMLPPPKSKVTSPRLSYGMSHTLDILHVYKDLLYVIAWRPDDVDQAHRP